MTKGHRTWTWAPVKPSSVPLAVKDGLSVKARQFVESELKPKHVMPPPSRPRSNYIVDISTKWRGRYFYFMSKYACPGPNAISPYFETGFARIEYQRNGRFSMAYMRHTGQWWQVYADLTVDEALDIIREHPLFLP